MALKLTKEEKKKIAIGVTLFIVFVVSYFMLLVDPAKAAKIKADDDLKALLPKIEAAKKQIDKVKNMEVEAPEIKLILNQVDSMIPSGPPDTWFPPKLQEILKSCGIENPIVTKSTESTVNELKDYKQLSWDMEIPQITFFDLCVALQTIENQETLFEITYIKIESNDLNPERLNLHFGINNLIRK